MTACPSRQRLHQFFDDRLDPDEAAEVRTHLEVCPTCPRYLDDLTGFEPEPDGADDVPDVPGFDGLTRLRRGGMGAVYKATQLQPCRTVALKMIRGDDRPQEQERLRVEAEAIARVSHPHIVTIYLVGECPAGPYLALEYCPGGSLKDRLTGGTPWPPHRAATLTEELARAVQHAHEHGVVHRDLKPSNVLFTAQGTVKVADFGLAVLLDTPTGLTRTGELPGTPEYMAPEQLEGVRRVGPTADVYALGVVLYELLTGHPPFKGTSNWQTVKLVQSQEPAGMPSAVPRDLETICLTCLEKDPRRRYASAAALADDLGRFRAGEPVLARPVGPGGRLWRQCRRRPLVAGLLAALLLTVAGGFSASVYLWQQAVASERQARDLLHKEEAARQDVEASQARLLQVLADFVQLGQSNAQTPNARWGLNLAMLRQAEAQYRSLLQQRPEDCVLRQALANVYSGLAGLHDAGGQTEEAIKAYQTALDLWEQLVHEDTGNLDYRAGLTQTCNVLGRVYRRQVRFPQALQAFRQACSVWDDMVEEELTASSRSVLAESRFQLGFQLNLMGQADEAIIAHDAGRVAWERLVQEVPGNRQWRHKLASSWWYLGELYREGHSQAEAIRCWRQTYEHCKTLLDGQPDKLDHKLSVALCCHRLMRGQATDPYYREAVQLFEQVAEGQAEQLAQNPGNAPWRAALAESYRLLAECHQKAGQTAQAARAEHQLVLVLDAVMSRHTDRERLEMLCQISDNYLDAGQPDAARSTARQAAALLAKIGSPAPGAAEDRYRLGRHAHRVANALRRAGEPAQALRLAEQSHQILYELVREAPQEHRYGFELYKSWEQVGKAYIALEQPEKAVTAWRQGVEVLRTVVAQAPSVSEYRLALGGRYRNLSRHFAGEKRPAEAETWLREILKLWPQDAERLREVSQEYEKLAAAVGQGRAVLSPAEQAERQHYLEQGARLAREAAAATPGPGRKP
jgi:tetratricopeptide (TPR) repeat protein